MIGGMQNEIQQLRGKEKDQDDRIEVLTIQSERYNEEIDHLKEQNKFKKERIAFLEEQNKIKEAEIMEVSKKVEEKDEVENSELPKQYAEILKSNTDLQNEIAATKLALAEVTEENKQIQKEITTTNTNIAESLGKTVKKDEFVDQLAHHAKNVETFANLDKEIIAFGVEEEEISDWRERIKKEREMVNKILKAIDEEWDGKGLHAHRRLGRYTPGGKRPLKITLESNEMAINFIQQAKKLKENAQLKDIGIRKCLSKQDRDTLKIEVQEMKRLNNDRSVEDQSIFFWTIRNLKATKIMIKNTPARQ